jgi:putative DNA primase/helicase
MTPETRNPAGQGQGSRDYRGGDPVPPEKPEAICLDCQDKPGQLEEVGRLILDGLAKVPANLTEAALHYARHGWPVFPTTIKKEPLTAHGYKDATTDPAKIRTTFRNPRAAGVAIPTGTITGLVVLDRDRKNGADGVATCEALEADLGALPPTLQQRTGSGGDQLFFRYPEGVTIKNSSGKLGKGFDVRSTGGLVVLPPSHNEAGSYAWLNDLDPAPLPQTWVDFLKERPRPEVERKPAPGIVAMESTAYGRKALEAECQAVASEPQGSRNARLNQAAFAVGQLVGGGEINEDEARLALQQAAVACGLNDSEADKTIRSGLTAGMAEPRQAPGESDWNPNGGQTAGKNAEKEARAQECKDGIFNGADLLEMDLPELVFAVVGLLPMGLAILAGGPKLGKSWLIYCICAALGAGRRVLGHFRASQAKSLYLALEDSKRRLQDRLKALCNADPAIKAGLANVDFQITWPRFDDEGGLEKLEEYIKENVPKGLKLVVVDTLAKVMPKSKSKGLNAYENDSIIMSRIKSMADKYGVCIRQHGPVRYG